MKDKLKDLVPTPIHVFNREISRIISEIKKEFITHFNMLKSLNDETQNNIHSTNYKIDEIDIKLEKLSSLDTIYQKVSNLDYLKKLENLDEITQKLENLDEIIAKLNNLDHIIAKLDKLEQLEKLEIINDKLISLEHSTDKLDQLKKLDKLEKLSKLEDLTNKLESNKASIDILHNLQNNIKANVEKNKLTVDETLWANIFNNTIQNSDWLPNVAIVSGRGEMGYPGLYLLYRVLNEYKPKSILEFGLGQATKIINHYTNAYPGIRHDVIENDLYWIEFFSNHYAISNRSHLVQLEYEMKDFKKGEKIRVYSEFFEKYENETFNFIVIDAPLGGEMKQYARIDILSILPKCLDDDFVILLDDYDRIGEKNTFKEIEDIFNKHKIIYHKGVYSGKKETLIIVSQNLRFLTIM